MKYVITDRDIKEKLTPRQAKKFRKLLSYIISEEELTLRMKKNAHVQIISKLLAYYENDDITGEAPFNKFTDFVASTCALDKAVDELMQASYMDEANCLSSLSDFYTRNYCINDNYLCKDNKVFEELFPTYDIINSLKNAIMVLSA